MPQFDVQDPETGQTLTLTGDTPPTEQELNEIFSQTRAPKAANPQPSSPPVAAASPEPESQGNWLSRWAARQAPLKGAGEAAAELPGKTLQWITAATRAALPSMAEDTDADRGLSAPINKSEEIERTISDPAVVLGKNLQDKAHGITGLTDEERKGVLTGIGAGAVNLAPLVASGPLAPLVMGAESYANHLVNDYTAAKKEGKSDDEAAEIAGNRARASGLTEATIWTVVPKLLKPVFEKYLIDKYGAKWFSKFLTKRAAMAGEVGAASGVSQAGQNVIEGKPVGENVPEAVGSGALMGVFTPGGKTKSEQEAEREMLGPNGETVDPRAVAWAGTFAAAGPQAETANVRAPVRVVPGDYVPPEPGPLRPIPDVRKQPGRLRVQLQSTQLTKDEQDAITQRQESQNDQLQYPGATQGAPVPENEPEVRQAPGEQAGSGDSAQSVGQEKAPDRLTQTGLGLSQTFDVGLPEMVQDVGRLGGRDKFKSVLPPEFVPQGLGPFQSVVDAPDGPAAIVAMQTLPTDKLRLFAGVFGWNRGGARDEILERISGKMDLYRRLAPLDKSQLEAMSGDQLNAILESAGLFKGGNKTSKALSILGWARGIGEKWDSERTETTLRQIITNAIEEQKPISGSLARELEISKGLETKGYTLNPDTDLYEPGQAETIDGIPRGTLIRELAEKERLYKGRIEGENAGIPLWEKRAQQALDLAQGKETELKGFGPEKAPGLRVMAIEGQRKLVSEGEILRNEIDALRKKLGMPSAELPELPKALPEPTAEEISAKDAQLKSEEAQRKKGNEVGIEEANRIRAGIDERRNERAQKAAATREAARQPDIIDWVEGNYPKGIKPSNVNEFGAYVDSAKGAARKLLFKTQGEDADKAAKEYTVYSGVETSEEDLLKQIADAGASRQDNEARRKLEDEAAVRAGKFSSAIKKGKFEISPEKLKIGDKVTVDYEPLTVKRIDARNGEVYLQGGDKFGQQVVRFGAKFRAQKFEERPARESRIAGDLFEGKPREPAAEKAEEAPATAPAAESGKNSPELSTPPPAEPKTEDIPPKENTPEFEALPRAAKGAAGEYWLNQRTLETGKDSTGKKADKKYLATLPDRQKQVLENFKTKLAKGRAEAEGARQAISLLDDFEEGGDGAPKTINDLVDAVEKVAIESDNGKLLNAVEKFRNQQDEEEFRDDIEAIRSETPGASGGKEPEPEQSGARLTDAEAERDMAAKYDEVAEAWYQRMRDSTGQDPKLKISAEDVAKEKGEELPQAQATARVQEWKDYVKKVREDRSQQTSDKIILSLYDSTGEWSKPWREAGYQVVQIDLNIVNEGAFGHEMNVMDIDQQWLEDNGLDMVHGVLCALPCTEYAVSGARWFKAKDSDGRTKKAQELFDHTMAIIEYLQPDGFWSLENPVGRLKSITSIPENALQFQPHNYGDPYTKRTQIFGDFNPDLPQANVEPPIDPKTGERRYPSYAHELWGNKEGDKEARSTTFEGFAYAFFMANHGRSMEAAAEAASEGKPLPEVMRRESKLLTEQGTTSGLRGKKEEGPDLFSSSGSGEPKTSALRGKAESKEPIVAEGKTLTEIKRMIPVGFDESSVRIENGRIVAKEKPGYGGRWMYVSIKKAEAEPYEPGKGQADLFSSPVNPEGKTPETKAPEVKPKLTPSENKELGAFVKRDRAVRDAKEGAEPLTPAERKRYDELMAKAGQEELPIKKLESDVEARKLESSKKTGLPLTSPALEFMGPGKGWPREGDYQPGDKLVWLGGEKMDPVKVLQSWRTATGKYPDGLAHVTVTFKDGKRRTFTGSELSDLTPDQKFQQKKENDPGSITPEQAATIEAVQKYRVKGAGPQTWTMVEKLAQNEAEKEAGEQPVKVRNDKTGKEEVMLETDLEPVRTRTAAEREATKGMSKKELDEALLKAGMEPSEFPDSASKRAALKRFRAKGGKASLDNEGQGGVRHEDAVAEVERARSKYPDAPPMQIVDRPDWIALGEDGNHYGIKGLWHSGRIWLNKAYVKNAEEARATLEHEIVHPLLETDAGVKAVEDAIASGLGKAKMDALIAKYGDRYVAQEEWFTKLAEEDRGLWKTIVDHVRQFLSKAGLVKLTDEEIGRGIIRMLRDKQSKVVRSDVEPTAKDVTAFGGKANLTDEPVNPEDMNPEDFDREGPAAALAPRTNRHQVAGVKRLGAEYEVENMARIREQVQEQWFNGSTPINPDSTAAAWDTLQRLVDPDSKEANAAQVRQTAGGEMAPGVLRNELWNYALRLAFSERDPTMLRFMVERNADIATLGGSSDTAAGRALRAARDRATGPLWASLVELTRERAEAAGQELGVGEDLFNELVSTINNLNIAPEDLERMIIEGVDRTGRPVREVLEDLTPETREAERILDTYEKSQTEWLKPEKQLSRIRQIIKDALGGALARYRDQQEFVDFVSGRFQEATVPKGIADRLAFEVWKDKQTREASATSKALRGEETREQRNAEAMLDRWAKEQTEWVKPERKNLVRDIIKEFMGRTVDKGNPERYRAELTQSIRGAGVPENIARELAFQAWNRKLTFDDARSARALEIERERLAKQAENTAKAMLNRLESRNTEWVKPDQKPGVAKIIADALRPLSAAEKKELGELAIRRDTPDQKSRYDELKGRDVLPESDVGSFVVPLRDRLVAAGVKADTAYRLAREIYQKRIDDWSAANRRAMDRAAGSGSIRSLIEAIRTSPYRSQMDPAWRIKTASDWFVSNGVERGRADAAAKLFNEQFEKAMGTAAEREARRILRDEEPKRLQDVIAAIRAGLTDPDRNWVDDIAMRKGYKPLTKEQHARIAELEQKFSDPNLSTAERVATTEQIFGVLRHTGYVSGATWRFIAGSYANSLLSGTRTLALHIFQPAASMLLRDIPMHVVTNLHHPGDIVTVGRLLLQAAKSWFPQAKFAWQNDAYTFSAHEMTLRHNELKRQFEIAQGELKSKTAAGIAKGTLRMLYAWQQYVTRALQTANQAGMAITRDIKLALYGSRAMRDFGLSTSEISQMVDVVSDAKRAAYEDGLLRGLDKATAAVVADEKANKALSDFFSNATNDQTAKDILKAAENDAYSIVGRRAPGVNEIDEAFLSRPLVWLMEAATKARSRSGQESMLSIALLGFVNVPLRLARFHMNSGPYALLRWGVDKYRKATNRETFWKQSFANSLQARQRLNEALFGAGLMLAGGLLGSTFHSSDEDASKKKFGVYFTGAGPKSKVLRDAWQKRGFRPYSIQVVVDGKMVNFPLTRVGQVLAQPFVLASTLDDAEWARKEAAASGKDVPQKLSETAALGVGNYYHMVIGDMGFFQSVEQGIRLGRGEKNIGASVLDKITGVAAATVLPGKQLLSNISDWFMGPLDRSSVQSAIAANFPVLGAPWQKKAMNRFGDELYDQTLYGKFQKSGLPFAIRISDTPENEKLYGLLLNKGAAAPDLRRYVIEEKYGPLSDEQWSKFAKTSGDSLKTAVLASSDGLKSASPDEVKKFLVQAGSAANNQAADELALQAKKEPKSGINAASGTPDKAASLFGGGSRGSSSGVSSPSISPTAGATARVGKRSRLRTGASSHRGASGGSKGTSKGRRLVHGSLKPRSGRIRHASLPKSHHRRLSAA